MFVCEVCCGFGGMFLIKYGDIFIVIVDEKCVNIKVSGVDVVVFGDVGCMFNIEGWLCCIGDMYMCVLYIV